MKKILFILFGLSFFCVAENSFGDSEQQLCVQTFNTYWMFYSDNLDERHRQTLEFLRQHDCDIILLQEVWEESHYQNLVQLSQDINMKSVYFKKPYDDKKSGLVGLFRGDVQDSDIFYFPSVFKSGLDFLYDLFKFIDKGFGVARVQTPSIQKGSFLVFNFHLDPISQTERISQLLLYLKWILENAYLDQAIIAGGDFNFEPVSLESRIMTNLFGFQNPYEKIKKSPECTHLCTDGAYSFFNFFVGEGIKDYIFFKSSSKTHFNPKDIFIFPKQYSDVFLSDHFGLRAIFSLRSPVENQLNQLFLEELLKDRIESVEQLLFEVESFFQNREEMLFFGDTDFSELNFIRSLHKDLKNPQSDIVQYLKY